MDQFVDGCRAINGFVANLAVDPFRASQRQLHTMAGLSDVLSSDIFRCGHQCLSFVGQFADNCFAHRRLE